MATKVSKHVRNCLGPDDTRRAEKVDQLIRKGLLEQRDLRAFEIREQLRLIERVAPC